MEGDTDLFSLNLALSPKPNFLRSYFFFLIKYPLFLCYLDFRIFLSPLLSTKILFSSILMFDAFHKLINLSTAHISWTLWPVETVTSSGLVRRWPPSAYITGELGLQDRGYWACSWAQGSAGPILLFIAGSQ